MGQTGRGDPSAGSTGRHRWLVATMVVTVAVIGAGTATLSRSSPSNVATTGDVDVVPDDQDLPDPVGRQQAPRPRVTCEREGAPVECVAWSRPLAPDGSDAGWHAGRVAVTSDHVLVRAPGTIMALSRTSGQVAWQTELDRGGGPVAVAGEVVAVQTGQEVHAFSRIDGSRRWSVDDAHIAVQGRDDPPGRIYTVQGDGAATDLVAHGADGTPRWRHTIATEDPAARRGDAHPGLVRVAVTEADPVTFVVPDHPHHDLVTIAVDPDDGTERWRRADSRPVHAAGDVAVVLDVDRDVREDDNSVTVSESPSAVVGLDASTGTERWRRDGLDDGLAFEIVDDVLVMLAAGELIGIDLATGEDLWRSPVAADERLITSSTAWRPSVSQHRHVVSFTPRERRVLARDPATGEILWQTQLADLATRVSKVDDAILATRSGSRSDDGERVDQTTVTHLAPDTGQARGIVTTESGGRPWFVSPDVLVDPESGWVVRIELSGS